MVRNYAASLGQARCVCRIKRKIPFARGSLRDWLREAPDLLQDALDLYANSPDWFGIDPNNDPVKRRTPEQNQRFRRNRGERGGHHPHAVSLGGPRGQKLTPFGKRGSPTWRRHQGITNFEGKIRREIDSFCTNRLISLAGLAL